jgi:hypothetical protein
LHRKKLRGQSSNGLNLSALLLADLSTSGGLSLAIKKLL